MRLPSSIDINLFVKSKSSKRLSEASFEAFSSERLHTNFSLSSSLMSFRASINTSISNVSTTESSSVLPMIDTQKRR